MGQKSGTCSILCNFCQGRKSPEIISHNYTSSPHVEDREKIRSHELMNNTEEMTQNASIIQDISSTCHATHTINQSPVSSPPKSPSKMRVYSKNAKTPSTNLVNTYIRT
ncbi:hypothetical protein SteCoe_14821 [Stentor coeruleus]|uniref:Uncharacterized protein n=1 Tax=Stentor coeruleus TaxID=5963 RepID=A0A1R2C573_9CILI|nr:hypothetical protein SteCoe_14821 [Stentor coeruleus]